MFPSDFGVYLHSRFLTNQNVASFKLTYVRDRKSLLSRKEYS